MRREPSDLEARLDDLYGATDEAVESLASSSHRAELESELVERFRAQTSSSHRGMFSMIFHAHRLRWVTLGLALTLGVVACTTPTTTEVDMGQALTFHVPQADPTASADFLDQTQEIEQWVSARPEVDNLNYNVSSTTEDDQTYVDLRLVVWGQHLDADRLVADMQKAYPILSSAEVETQDLVGQVRESFAHKVARETLNLEVSGNTAEEIRANILAQLASAGLAEGAQVDVQQDDGLTTIGVTIEADGDQTEDVIEILGDELPEGFEVPLGSDLSAEDGGPVIIETIEKKSGHD